MQSPIYRFGEEAEAWLAETVANCSMSQFIVGDDQINKKILYVTNINFYFFLLQIYICIYFCK